MNSRPRRASSARVSSSRRRIFMQRSLRNENAKKHSARNVDGEPRRADSCSLVADCPSPVRAAAAPLGSAPPPRRARAPRGGTRLALAPAGAHRMASPGSASRTSFGEAAYHEFYRDDFEPREHYRPLWEHIRTAGQSALADEGARGALALQHRGRDLHGLRRRRRRASSASGRSTSPAHHPGRRVGADRGRPQAARARAQPLPATTSTTSSACSRTASCPPS